MSTEQSSTAVQAVAANTTIPELPPKVEAEERLGELREKFERIPYSMILPGLYLGAWEDARDLNEKPDFVILTVFDSEVLFGFNLEQGKAQRVHIPVMEYRPGYEPHARKDQLDLAADVIEASLARGKKILVHCAMGVERSPLTIAWYLHTKLGFTLYQAYALLKKQRPVVADRREWLKLYKLPPQETMIFDLGEDDAQISYEQWLKENPAPSAKTPTEKAKDEQEKKLLGSLVERLKSFGK